MPIARMRFASSIRASLLGSCFAGALALMPGLAAAGEAAGRTPMILSHLPAPSSTAYESLRKLAGEANGQALDMTKAEMWSVPSQNVEAVKKAAGELGVEIIFLDENWNRTLAPMDASASMSRSQKRMMTETMQSKAAMGMSMTELQNAKVMEYALTKSMDAPSIDPGEVSLVIPVSNTLKVTARRTHVEKTAEGYIWHGVTDGTGEPVSLMWWPAGRMTGQVTYQGHVYVVKHMGGAMHGVVEMAPKVMPPEHAPMDSGKMKRMKMTSDPLIKEGDPSKLRQPKAGSVRPSERELRNQQDAPIEQRALDSNGRAPVTAPPRNEASGAEDRNKPIEIAMLVAYTRAAARHYTDIKRDLIELAVADANQSFRASGIGNVRLKVVHTYQTDYREKGSHFDHVFAFADKGDGKMEAVHRLRDKYKADVALLIVDDSNGCGLAAGVAPAADRAFAVVHHQCAAISYSLAHEIGHIIGARHDLGLDDSMDPFPFGHGFVHGTEWRTLMSYEDSCGKCPRLPIWSSPDIVFRGVPAGDGHANNARVILENAARVAAFR